MDAETAKFFSIGIALGMAAIAAGLGIAKTGGEAVKGISRNPEAAPKIQTAMFIGLVFAETLMLYTLVIVLLLMFGKK